MQPAEEQPVELHPRDIVGGPAQRKHRAEPVLRHEALHPGALASDERQRQRIEQPVIVVGVEVTADERRTSGGVHLARHRAELIDSLPQIDARVEVHVVDANRATRRFDGRAEGDAGAAPETQRDRLQLDHLEVVGREAADERQPHGPPVTQRERGAVHGVHAKPCRELPRDVRTLPALHDLLQQEQVGLGDANAGQLRGDLVHILSHRQVEREHGQRTRFYDGDGAGAPPRGRETEEGEDDGQKEAGALVRSRTSSFTRAAPGYAPTTF